MCGRFALYATPEELIDAFDLEEVSEDYGPAFNIAPTLQVAVVPNRPTRRLRMARWGLIPSWAKDRSIGSRMINARSETLKDKPSFRSAFKRRRCLVLASGFYEWKKEGKAKVPHFIRMKTKRPFAFAGLWEIWKDPDGDPESEKVASCTIVTTSANALIAPIHKRMPVILPAAAIDPWLDQSLEDPEALLELLQPHDPDGMEVFPVSTYVSKAGNEGASCIEPA